MFADADGATKFEDITKLQTTLDSITKGKLCCYLSHSEFEDLTIFLFPVILR